VASRLTRFGNEDLFFPPITLAAQLEETPLALLCGCMRKNLGRLKSPSVRSGFFFFAFLNFIYPLQKKFFSFWKHGNGFVTPHFLVFSGRSPHLFLPCFRCDVGPFPPTNTRPCRVCATGLSPPFLFLGPFPRSTEWPGRLVVRLSLCSSDQLGFCLMATPGTVGFLSSLGLVTPNRAPWYLWFLFFRFFPPWDTGCFAGAYSEDPQLLVFPFGNPKKPFPSFFFFPRKVSMTFLGPAPVSVLPCFPPGPLFSLMPGGFLPVDEFKPPSPSGEAGRDHSVPDPGTRCKKCSPLPSSDTSWRWTS